ncbi:MAG TPA: efflux RND transporter periplasmic adaptor subunit [Nitrospira sp.]|nr:efflux RND transporter periplasmic adaptor subunit [Nitrospira sp.]
MPRRSEILRWLLPVLLISCGEQAAHEPAVSKPVDTAQSLVRVDPKAQLEIDSQSVQLRQPTTELAVQGRIQYDPDRYVKISSALSGIVKTVHGKLGKPAKRDESLLTIESPDIITTYAQLTEAESDRNLALRQLSMARDLYNVKALPKKDFNQAEFDAKRTQADYERIRERLLALMVPAEELDQPPEKRRITGRFEVKSPLDGIIVEKHVSVGQLIASNEMLYTVANLDVLQAVGDIYERDLRMVKTGLPVTVTVESVPAQRFNGIIRHIGDVVDPTSRTVKIRCDVGNETHLLKADEFARITIEFASPESIIAVPVKAVIRLADKSFVFVDRSQGEFERREVVLGSSFGDFIEVRDGLKNGEHIAVKGTLLLEGALEKQVT